MEAVDPKCANCSTPQKKMVGPKHTIETSDDADNISDALDIQAVVGNVLCSKCWGCARFSLSKIRKTMTQVSETDSQQTIGTETSSESPTQAIKKDPVYEPVQYQKPDVEESIELPYRRVVATHKYCFMCGKTSNLINISFEVRQQIFVEKEIFIPQGNRCCDSHLIKNRLYADEVQNLRIVSHSSSIKASDLRKLLQKLCINSDRELTDRIADFSISEERIYAFTGLNWEHIIKLREMMTSLRNSDNRNVTQALVAFLFRLRSGNSNEMISAILGLERHQQVSAFSQSILNAFETDVLPSRFGLKAANRDQLIRDHTTPLLNELHNVSDDNLVLVADGTYIKHQKSSNNEYQRKSYSGHKKVPLCKPFTICTTDGFIVDVLGPFYATENDATILETILNDAGGDLKKLMCKENDVFVLDRGFRDIKNRLEGDKYRVLMPSLKNKNEKQLTAKEANESRLVTMFRWVVEAVHGSVAQKYKFFHHQLDNRYLPKASLYCKIVCFLINEFGKRLVSRASLDEDIKNYILSKNNNENSLAVEAQTAHWSRRKSSFQKFKSLDVLDFPEITESDLIKFFTGTYQLQQTVSYLAEMMNDDNEIDLSFCKVCTNIIKIQVRSRHVSRRTYNCYIDYKPNTISSAGILRHYCECSNGMRTIGCCSHVAAVIYYLSHARYQSKILRPAEILTKIYEREQITPVIEKDSDED